MSLIPPEEMLVYCASMKHWGAEAQVRSFCEEFGEAIKAINHFLRGRANEEAQEVHIIEELVDLHILSKQMAMLVVGEDFSIEDVEKWWKFWMKEKLDVISGRLRKAGEDV